MPTAIHNLDGWSFLVGFLAAYLTIAIACVTVLCTTGYKISYIVSERDGE